MQVYVSQLRKLLGDGALETRPAGYLLRVEPGALDLRAVREPARAGPRLLAEGAAEEAGELLREALALWRGRAAGGLRVRDVRGNAIGRLEELRLAALELRLDADLALGRHAEFVAELEGSCASTRCASGCAAC